MNSIKSRYWIIILLICAFAFGGLLHVALYGRQFASCIVQIYYGAVVVIWAMSIQLRIIQMRVRNCLLLIASMLLIYLIFQVERYKLINSEAFLLRNVWYWYYVPMIGIPLLFYLISRTIYSDNEALLRPINILMMICGSCLCIGFVTNDLHGLAFHFADYNNVDQNYSLGPIYWGFVLYMFVLYAASLVNIIRKNQLIAIKRLSWMPLVVFIIGVIGAIVAETTEWLAYNGIRIWNLTEWYAFIVIAILESSILIGLIPSNLGYIRMLESMPIPIELRDKSKKTILHSRHKSLNEEQMQINTFPILGGDITWAVDMSNLYKLNEQLEAATEQLKNRNNYLQTENNTKEEQETLNSRNRVYDKITQIVLPQLIEVDSLLDAGAADEVDANLPYVAVLNTYIKRRCNMELMKEDKVNLPLLELKLAVSESASYLQLCDVQTAVSGSDEGEYPADEIISAYEHFENIVESHIDCMDSIMIVIIGAQNGITTRIMIDDEPVDEFITRREAYDDYAFV